MKDRFELVPPADVRGEIWLETLRAAGAKCRAETPARPVGGVSPTAAEAKRFLGEFLATGEAEELDFWNVADTSVTSSEMAELRKMLDGAGGGAVKLLVGGCEWNPFAVGTPEGNLLLTGSGRVLLVEPNGRETWIKTGCGNVHKAVYFERSVYYSNGGLWCVKYGLPGDPLARPELVWKAENEVGGGVLGFDIASDGWITAAVNSTDEILELSPYTKKARVRFKVDARGPDGKLPPPHAHLRMAHRTAAGTFLVACAGAGAAREYDKTGKLVWEQVVPGGFVFDAIRLTNGNTLVSHLDAITEYTPKHEKVWSFACADAPELKLKFLCTVQEKGKGASFVVGTWANGSPAGDRTTAFEVSRKDKRILWAYNAKADVNMMGALRIQR